MPKSFYEKKKPSIINAKTIVFTVIVVLFVLSHLTVPSEHKMRRAIKHYVMSDIKSTSINDTATNADARNMFYAYNTLDVFHHYFYATAHIHNRYKTQDKLVSVGVLGIVIPLVDWNDYIVTNGPAKRHLYHGGKKGAVNTQIIGDEDYDTGELPEDE